MSEQLKDASVELLRTALHRTADGASSVAQSEEQDHSKELEYAGIYNELIDKLDELLVLANSSAGQYDAIEKKLDPVVLLHDLSDYPADLEGVDDSEREEYLRVLKVNTFYRRMMEVRKQASENTLTSLPILRAIHQVEGVTNKESQILPLLAKRDQASSEIMILRKKIQSQESNLIRLMQQCDSKMEQNAAKAKIVRDLMRQRTDKQKVKSKEKQEELKELKEELYQVKLRSSILSEFVTALISSSGLNWGEDSKLTGIVLYCGDEPDDDDDDL